MAPAHNLLALDADGVARRCIPFVRVGDMTIPALAVEGAIEALGLHASDVRFEADGFWLGDRLIPLAASEAPTLDGGTRVVRRLPIAYRGVWPDQRRTYRTYSFAQLFQSEEQLLAGEKADVDPVAFKGKVVIVGATAAGLYDQKAVPFAQKMSGPEIHANIVDSILSGRFISPAVAVDVGSADAGAGARRCVCRRARWHLAGRHLRARAGWLVSSSA